MTKKYKDHIYAWNLQHYIIHWYIIGLKFPTIAQDSSENNTKSCR